MDHSSFILSCNLIGQRENKSRYVTEIVLLLEFADVIFRGREHPRRPRGSQSEAGEMARRKFSRTGGRTPGYQVSPDHFQTALRIFAKPFGNGPVRLGTQGFFRPFLKTFVAPFRPPPTDCPWVSEDGERSDSRKYVCVRMLFKYRL